MSRAAAAATNQILSFEADGLPPDTGPGAVTSRSPSAAFIPDLACKRLQAAGIALAHRYVVLRMLTFVRRDSAGRWPCLWAVREVARLSGADKSTAIRARKALLAAGLATVIEEADPMTKRACVIDLAPLLGRP